MPNYIESKETIKSRSKELKTLLESNLNYCGDFVRLLETRGRFSIWDVKYDVVLASAPRKRGCDYRVYVSADTPYKDILKDAFSEHLIIDDYNCISVYNSATMRSHIRTFSKVKGWDKRLTRLNK